MLKLMENVSYCSWIAFVVFGCMGWLITTGVLLFCCIITTAASSGAFFE